MTTIVWDGITLAGDRRATTGDTPTVTRKVFRIKHPITGKLMLYGCSGDTGALNAYRWWLRNPYQPRPELKNMFVMMIDDRRRIWVASGDTMLFWRIGKRYWALGSGSDYALGAMAAGKTAREAVRIAITLDVGSGNGVDVVSFK